MNKISKNIKNVILFIVFLCQLSACVVIGQHKGTNEEIARVNVDLAVEYYNQNRLDVALTNLKKALAADDESVEANSLIALVYDRLEEKGLAEKYFEMAVKYVQSDSLMYGQIHNNFGVFLCQNDKSLVAEEHFMLAINNKLYESPASAYENAGLCVLTRSDVKKAYLYFEKALENNPKMARSLFEKAKIDFELKKYEQAQEALLNFHKINKAVPQSLWLASEVEIALGNKNKAQKLLTQLKHDFPDSKEAVKVRDSSPAVD